MKKIGFILAYILCILFMSTNVKAATPRVMVSDYEIKGGAVISGENFDLTITVRNESANPVKNLKISLSAENGELLPREGAGGAYVKEIKGENEEKITFPMKAAFGLEEKSYKLSVKTEYEGGGIGYTVDEAVFIPVTLKQRLSVTDIYFAESSYEVGETVEISGMVNNLGSGMLYNVSAKIVGDNLSNAETYIGNIESGKSGNIDVLSKATAVTEGQHKLNQIIIYYEDKSGTSYENTIDLEEIHVTATVYEDFEVVKESKDYHGIVKIIVWVVLIVAVVILIVWLILRRKKKKQAYLEEF